MNGLALAAAEQLLVDGELLDRWSQRVQAWVGREQPWLRQHLDRWPQLSPMPSAANFLLVRGDASLVPLREALEGRHGILVRDCRSFVGLGEHWLRIGLQHRGGHRRLLSALARELSPCG